jgi:argininosuccinate lyase
VDTTIATLSVLAALVGGLRFRADRMRQAAEDGFLLATDLADYLVARGLPFREAHHKVGALVRYAQESGKTFADLTLEEFRNISPLFDEDVCNLRLEDSVAARRSLGGTAPTTVAVALRRARARWRRYAR